MIQLLEFFVLIVVVSISGVMAPGPLFVANVSYGLRGGTKAGLKIAAGHAIVELPIVVVLGIGAISLESFLEYRVTLSVLGAVALFAFAGIQIRSVFKSGKNLAAPVGKSPLIAGMALSGLNPFFIVWWLTIGFKLISDALSIWGIGGILILFTLHIWMDFAWMCAVAHLASKGAKILSDRNLKIVMSGLSLVLIYFGITFLVTV